MYYFYECGNGYIGQDGYLYWNLEAVYNFHSNAMLGPIHLDPSNHL